MHALEPACDIAHELNHFLRRLRQYQTQADWLGALLDGASRFATQFAVLALRDGVLSLLGERNLNLSEDFSFNAASAGAFAAAIDSNDSVVSLRTPREVTENLSAPEAAQRAHIIPITNGSRVVAVLFATNQGGIDVNALELVAGMSSIVLERQANASLHAHIAAPAAMAVKKEPPQTAGLPLWAGMNENQRDLHLRAQRFSRVTVAEMQLHRPEACRAGREQNNLYVFLKKEIDEARETYRTRFMTIPSMVDYLHLELVRTAADGEELKLGADYPGQLV